MSSAVSAPAVQPAASVTKTFGTASRTGSGLGSTAAPVTAGCSTSPLSSSNPRPGRKRAAQRREMEAIRPCQCTRRRCCHGTTPCRRPGLPGIRPAVSRLEVEAWPIFDEFDELIHNISDSSMAAGRPHVPSSCVARRMCRRSSLVVSRGCAGDGVGRRGHACLSDPGRERLDVPAVRSHRGLCSTACCRKRPRRCASRSSRSGRLHGRPDGGARARWTCSRRSGSRPPRRAPAR